MDTNIIYYNLNEQEEKQLILKQYKRLIKSLEKRRNNTKEKLILVKKAFKLSTEAHSTMRRKSGEPYILHPIAVAQIVVDEIGLGTKSTMAALLHDVVEDTDITLSQIEIAFGKEVAFLVKGLTKIQKIADIHKSTQAENIKKILVSLVADARVILIKIADRLHNLRTLNAMSLEKKIRIAGETKQIYIPIAHRLGFYNIKTELEDLCMKYLESAAYNEIKFKLKESKSYRELYIKEFIDPLKRELKKSLDVPFVIEGRPKSIFSIWKKIQNQNIRFEDIFDLFAIRIIVDCPIKEEKEYCWQVYSILDSKYQTLSSRLRDWLTNPKANGYQALHITVLGHNANWVEIQIRSSRMNAIAEKGVAAHFLYKEKNAKIDVFDNWFLQIRELIKSEELESVDVVTKFQSQINEENIYVITPRGDVKILPVNSTVLDFAYTLHSNLGNHCLGAKVNHKLESLSNIIHSGDRVEILTSVHATIQPHWLDFVKTQKAINNIKAYLKTRRKEEISRGNEILEQHFTHNNLFVNNVTLQKISTYFHVNSIEDLFVKIANNQIDLQRINTQLLEQIHINPALEENYFIDEKTFKYKFSPCCNPIHGDSVFGLLVPKLNVNRVEIHRTGCIEAEKTISKYECKILQIKWDDHEKIKFLASIKLSGFDKVGMIHELTNIITENLKINIATFFLDASEGTFKGAIKVYIENKNELDKLISALKNVAGIEEVLRVI